jgi:hypothetical protein
MKLYYLRFHNRISGPFGADDLRRMAADALITDKHEVSDNRQVWFPARQVHGLFPEPEAASQTDADSGRPASGGLAEPQPASTSVNWFYSYANQTIGPVSGEALISLASQGVIYPDDLVWREGSANAAPAASEPLLASHFPENVKTSEEAEHSFSGRILRRYLSLHSLTVILFQLLTLLALGLIPLGIILDGMTEPAWVPIGGLYVIAIAPSFSAYGVLWLIALFRHWRLVNQYNPWDDIRPTPGEAVGFLFIPIFWCYWSFIAIYKLGLCLMEAISALAPNDGLPPTTNAGFIGLILSIQWTVTNIAIAANLALSSGPERALTLLLLPLLLPTSFIFYVSASKAARRLKAAWTI